MIYIVIPAYNEEKSIVSVLSTLRDHHYDNVVVVDDGSSDRTYELAKSQGVIVLNHCINRGQGAALATGTAYALECGADIIVHFDADGQFDVSDIENLIAPVKQGEVDIVFGSRFLDKKSNIPIVRKFILKCGILFQWFLTGVKLSDAHNGFRAMNRKAASCIQITQDRAAHNTEILEETIRNGLRYREVPVRVYYTPYSLSRGQSSLDAIKIVWDLIKGKVL